MSNDKITVSVALFISYLMFFLWGAYHLPIAAGPDESANIATIKFYQQEKRLAHFPEDVERTTLSPYGSTRLTRPPFPFVFAAITDSKFHSTELPYFASRISTALTLAITIVVIFHIALSVGAQLLSAVSATIIATTIPQYLFYGTYINDDAGAFLAAALLTLILIHLIKAPRLSARLLVLAAFGCGFTFINKETAWAIFPAFAITTVVYLIQDNRWRFVPSLKFWVIAIIAFIIGGGCWLIYNISVYGPDDPFQMKISAYLNKHYAHLVNAGQRGYLFQKGMSYSDLLSDRHFLYLTYEAIIGRLGLLDVKLNPFVYLWYGLISLFVLLTYATYVIRSWLQKRGSEVSFFRLMTLFSALWVLSQIALYLYFNVHIDIQIQGKYLLPTLPVFVIFLALGLQYLTRKIRVSAPLWLSTLTLANIAVGSFTLFQRVIPFYYPAAYDVYLTSPIEVDFYNEQQVRNIRRMDFSSNPKGAYFKSLDKDPLIILAPEMCNTLGKNFEATIHFNASQADRVTIYVDEGHGFTNLRSYDYEYDKGATSAHIPVSVNNCKYIRFDLMDKVGTELNDVRISLTSFHAQRRLLY